MGAAKGEPVPAHVGQALALTMAIDELGITPASAQATWVVSAPVLDPLMRPAFWANLVVEGRQPSDFWEAVAAADEASPVYLSGASTLRTFHGDVIPAGVFKSLHRACTGCQLVEYGNALYAVGADGWFDAKGVRLAQEEAEGIRRMFAALAQSVEGGDIPREMAERWRRLLEESPQEAPATQSLGRTRSPVMHVGTQFFKAGVGSQSITENTCLRWFLWSCTIRRVQGQLSRNASVDFGNGQFISSNIRWNANPLPDYADPVNAPSRAGSGLWGAWDYGTQGLVIGPEYGSGQYVVGCGPMSVARLLDWGRAAGMFTGRTIRLPNNPSTSGGTVTVSAGTDLLSQERFMQTLFWPVKVGDRNVNGVIQPVYSGWLSQKTGTSHYRGEGTTTTSGVLNGANAWLAEVGWPERITGAWSRDFDLAMVFTLLPPALNWVGYTQATWGVNGTLKDSIGAPSGQDMPAIVLYQTGNSNVFVNGIRIGIAHYALAKKFTAIEYWDWSENYVELDPSPIIGDFPYWNGNWRVFLSDYYDMTFGAFRLRR